MEITFRLQQILEERGDQERGVIKRISQQASLERHQVAALFHNRVKYVSLESLAAVCNFLVRHYHIDPAQLPGMLFGLERGGFWSLLAERHYLELCLGMRRRPDLAERAWVMASDSLLQGTLLHEVSGTSIGGEENGANGARPTPRALEQRLVSSPDESVDIERTQEEAKKVCKEFAEKTGDRALVCLGSQKCNPVVEMILAEAFRAEPFQSITRLRDAKVPFLFRYRRQDPDPPSCCGGRQIKPAQPMKRAGIYYETAQGEWPCCPCNSREDAALVFYRFHRTAARLHMVLAGFSGRATRCLASVLEGQSTEFWPPGYATSELQVGAFIVQLKFKPSKDRSTGPARHDSADVIPISPEVLKRRLEG